MQPSSKAREVTRGGLNSGDLSSEEGTGKSLVQSKNSGDLSSEEGTGKSLVQSRLTSELRRWASKRSWLVKIVVLFSHCATAVIDLTSG
jgi:hypothetical protein